MLTILVIEECEESSKIRNLIDWTAENYSLLGIVSNGIIGRAIAERQRPDIILLSTTSQYLGGQSFIDSVTTDEYTPQIIQLYSDEKSVRRINVPSNARLSICRSGFSKESLLSILAKASSVIQLIGSNTIENYQPFFAQRNEAFTRILQTPNPPHTIERLAEEYNLHIISESTSLALFYPENKPLDEVTFKQLVNHLDSLLRQGRNGEVFFRTPDEIGVELCDRESRKGEDSYTYFWQVLESMSQSIESQLGFKVHVVWNETPSGYKSLHNSYLELKKLSAYRYFLPDTNLLNTEYCKKHAQHIPISSIDHLLQQLQEAVAAQSLTLVESLLYDIYISNARSSMDFAVVGYIRSGIETIYNNLIPFSPQNIELHFDNFSFENVEQEYLSIRAFFSDSVRKSSSISAKAHPVTKAVIEYITRNYQKDISLEMVADFANVSCGYLSRLFRKDIGVTFNAYLTKIRIQKAQQLLTDTSIRVSDVSKAVGYSDDKYFSRIFKKHTGVAPRQYQRITKEKDGEER